MMERYLWYHAEEGLLELGEPSEGCLPGREGGVHIMHGERKVAAIEESNRRRDETEFHMRCERGECLGPRSQDMDKG